jgi:hypothetical protein
MKSYKLVNPYIIGSMETTFQAESSLKAAQKAYDNLSQYFGNHMPEFNMTLKRLSTDGKVIDGAPGSFLHFNVKEKAKGKSDEITYEIKEISGVEKKKVVSFQERLNKVANQDNHMQEQNGGVVHKKKKYVDGPTDDDDELSDYFDLDYERPRRGPLVYEPISYYWYDPFVYPLVDRWYVPTFVLPLQPRVVFDSHSLLYLGR